MFISLFGEVQKEVVEANHSGGMGPGGTQRASGRSWTCANPLQGGGEREAQGGEQFVQPGIGDYGGEALAGPLGRALDDHIPAVGAGAGELVPGGVAPGSDVVADSVAGAGEQLQRVALGQGTQPLRGLVGDVGRDRLAAHVERSGG
ncbi:MAG: hypothetical protein ACRDOH_17855 [Streptosporangiaceae bacterium]